MKRPLILGVTGGLATGKSTVARMFGKLGASVLDADKIAHGLIKPGGPVYKKVISVFGRGILDPNGRINRGRLAGIVFEDKKKLVILNTIVHPEVISKIRSQIKKRAGQGRPYIIDAPLLTEAGLLDMIDMLVVVSTDRKTQIKRAKRRSRISRREIARRIGSQLPLAKKKRLADFIIDNSGSLHSTKKEVNKIWRETKRWHRAK